MNLKFIEGGQARHKVVKFRGVGITDKKIVDGKGEGGGVGVVAEKHGVGSFSVPMLGEEGDKAVLR